MCAVRQSPTITGSLAQDVRGWTSYGTGTADPVGVHGPIVADFIELDPQDAGESIAIAHHIAGP